MGVAGGRLRWHDDFQRAATVLPQRAHFVDANRKEPAEFLRRLLSSI
jgi:hypothetical protein